MRKIRLQVALAKAGAASRRKAALLIKEGSVNVNNRVVTEPGFRTDPEKDEIEVYGRRIQAEKKYYYILNKPAGVISTASDELKRKTVVDFTDKKARLYPVGRLDRDTTGLLILTNDGDLAYRLTHPKFEIPRVYEIKTDHSPDTADLNRLRKGVMLDGKIARAQEIILKRKKGRFFVLNLMISEGRKHEIRKMFEAIGYGEIGLKRVSFGPVKLGDLREGYSRPLKENEIDSLKKYLKLT